MGSIAASAPSEDYILKVLAPYGVSAGSVSDQHLFVNEHIASLVASDNEVIARTGFVLARASEGFGLGHRVPLSLIAMGQKLLGIDLAVAAPFIASNPAAFTAASIGAVYWGYQALDEDEKAQLHAMIGEAFAFGVELVKTLAEFCIRTLKSLLDSEAFAQLRQYVADAATAVGSSLYEVTGRIYDRASEVANAAISAVSGVGTAVGAVTDKTIKSGKSLISRSKEEKK